MNNGDNSTEEVVDKRRRIETLKEETTKDHKVVKSKIRSYFSKVEGTRIQEIQHNKEQVEVGSNENLEEEVLNKLLCGKYSR